MCNCLCEDEEGGGVGKVRGSEGCSFKGDKERTNSGREGDEALGWGGRDGRNEQERVLPKLVLHVSNRAEFAGVVADGCGKRTDAAGDGLT